MRPLTLLFAGTALPLVIASQGLASDRGPLAAGDRTAAPVEIAQQECPEGVECPPEEEAEPEEVPEEAAPEEPVEEAPAEEAPTEGAPAEPPAQEAVPEQAPEESAPEEPVEEAPVEEAPAEPPPEEAVPEEAPEEIAPEEPVEEAPAEEAPAEEAVPDEAAPEEPSEGAPAEPSAEEAEPEEPAEEVEPEEAEPEEPAEEAPEEPSEETAPEEQPEAAEPEEPSEGAPAEPSAEEAEPDEPSEAVEPEAEPEEAEPEEAEEPSAGEEAEEPSAEEETQEPPSQEETLERARERQQELQGQEEDGEAAEEEPEVDDSEAEQPEAAEEGPEADDSEAEQPEGEEETEGQEDEEAQDEESAEQRETEVPEAVMEDTTVEEQLEAQGNEEEASNVRSLRQELFQEFDRKVRARAEDDEDEDETDEPRRLFYDRDERFGEVVRERGDRIIINLGDTYYVQPVVPDDGGRLLYGARDVEVVEESDGFVRTVVYRRDGVQVITIRDRYGYIVRRIKRYPDGVDIVLIDNRYPEYDDPDFLIVHDFPPPRITIPHEHYIVDLSHASEQEIHQVLLAPPVQEIDRTFTLPQVLRNEQIRAYSPRIDLDTITFATGSAVIGEDQMPALAALGEAMEEVIAEHPEEVYLIEGHTDAVGPDEDNLILSAQRAEAVAVALSQNFDIPPENLVTEGYGEQYLKVDTEGPDRRNRRVTVRRLTELLQSQN